MKKFLIYQAPFIMLFIAAVINILMEYSIYDDGVFEVLSYLLMTFVGGLFSLFVIDKNKYIGNFYYTFFLASHIIISLGTTSYELSFFGFKESEILAKILIICLYFFFIMIFGYIILPAIEDFNPYSENDSNDSYNKELIQKGIQNIKSSFDSMQSAVSNEVKGIDAAMNSLRQTLESQQAELLEVDKKLKKSMEELEYYKNLASLSKKQQEAVLHALQKGKYKDYIIGFLLGVLGSALVSYAPQIIQLN